MSKKIYRGIALLIGLLLSLPSLANDNELASIQKKLVIPNLFQCKFEQKRHIASMKQALLSNGEIILDKDQGVIFKQLQPFQQLVVMTEKKIYQALNTQEQLITAQEQPQLFHFTGLIFDLLQGNWQQAQDTFAIQSMVNKSSGWEIVLKPIKSPLDKVFQTIKMGGNKTVDYVVLTDKQNDVTTLNFNACQELTKLSNEQNKLFTR